MATQTLSSYTYEGYLRDSSDIDIFRFYNDDTNDITIQLSVPDDFDLYLYAVHDSVISILDSSTNTGNTNEEIVYNNLPEGIYYAFIRPNDTSSNPFSLEISGFTNYSENEHDFTMAYDFGKHENTCYNENKDGIAVHFEYDSWDNIYLTGLWYYITDIDVIPGNGNDGTFNLEILDAYKESLLNDSTISVTPSNTGWNYIDLSGWDIYFWGNIYAKINWDGMNTPGFGFYNNSTDNHTYIYSEHDSTWHINDTNAFLIRADMKVTPYSFGNDSCYCNTFSRFTSDSGSFDDGSGSDNYANYSDCEWLIQPPGANQVSLRFLEFETEDECDFVFIYDGATTSAPLLAEYSGYGIPYPVTSTGGSMLVHFVTDGSVTDAGWSAVYDTSIIEFDSCQCKTLDTITQISGTINDGSGIYRYNNNTDCKWLIQQPGAESIKLKFTEFAVEEEYDYVYVYDGASTSSPKLGEYTGYTIPDTIYSTGNSMLIHFESDDSYTDEGWDAYYTIEPIPDNIDPTITCAGDQTVNIQNAVSNYYTVTGTGFDPVSTGDNIHVASLTNDYNHSSSLQNMTFKADDTTVTWTVSDAAGNHASCMMHIKVNNYVGIDMPKTNELIIYPNPTTGILYYNIKDTKIQHVIVTDIAGKIIMNNNINNTGARIDLMQLDEGIYFVHFITPKHTFIEKIIKK